MLAVVLPCGPIPVRFDPIVGALFVGMGPTGGMFGLAVVAAFTELMAVLVGLDVAGIGLGPCGGPEVCCALCLCNILLSAARYERTLSLPVILSLA